MTATTRTTECSVKGATLYLAFELGSTKWTLGFTTAPAQRPRMRTIAAGDVRALEQEVLSAKARFGLPLDAAVRSCYEAGRDGFWLHRWLLAHGIANIVADSSSIEVNRKARRAKTDRWMCVIIWGHDMRGGDCAGSGYLYNGKSIPALRGKFVYNDITTGRIWYSEYKDMLAADDGNPKTMARMHEVKILWNDPHDTPDAGKKLFDTMFPIVQTTFRQRGSKAENMNGKGRVSGERADVRLAVDEAGEMYVYSKSDGMIRRVVAATPAK